MSVGGNVTAPGRALVGDDVAATCRAPAGGTQLSRNVCSAVPAVKRGPSHGPLHELVVSVCRLLNVKLVVPAVREINGLLQRRARRDWYG